MKKLVLILTIILISPLFLNAQLTKKEIKVVKKSQKFYEKQEYKKAIDKLSPVLNKHDDICDLWKLEITYRKAIKLHPDMLEPRKYAVDAYIDMQDWKNAEKECVNALFAYPETGMFDKLAYIVYQQNSRFNRHWMKRDFVPNIVEREQNELTEEPWKYYREAKEKIISYCDSNGIIIKKTSLTEQKYMEVYCWEYMLEKSDDEILDFARMMQEKGYLDCYALLSMFHYSIFDQYKDFTISNKEHLRKFIQDYLIE